ncbi:DUF5633 domain-containing protein [Anaerococcus rubeinfantis]|uniref:DUF5633 domain-containing protein n=1 Tax=Anaerococcus rubeinfantis TaxID=1720199 RepID=UPI00073F02F7|nr:DUF5633 domain-containing protein [Anaerococcus rubeinfantis]
MVLSSALILALSISVIQPAYGQEGEPDKVEEINITIGEEDKSYLNLSEQENLIDEKTDSKENKDIDKDKEDKEDKSTGSLNNKEDAKDISSSNIDDIKDENNLSSSNIDDKNNEKDLRSEEEKSSSIDESRTLLLNKTRSSESEHFSINFEVPNRRVYDWVKESSTLYYNGKAVKIDSSFYSHANHREYIRISDYFELGKTYDFEIKYDKDNKTYAKGSLTLPDQITPEETNFRLVNLELSENVKRRVFDLYFYAVDKEGNLCLFDGVNNFYVNGENIGKIYNSLYNNFEGEVGKPYCLELRGLDNTLEYSGTFNMPVEGELLGPLALPVVLTPSKNLPHYNKLSIHYGREDQMTRMANEILTVNKEFRSYKLNPKGFGMYSLTLAPIPSQREQEHQLYKNRDDAVKAAQAALDENESFKSYEIKQDEDGLYYYILSTKDVKERKDIFSINIGVLNRKINDWIKPGSSLIIDGKSYNLDNYNDEIEISKELTLDLNGAYSVEIKDANGKTYATGSFTTPDEYVEDGLDKSIKVKMKLSEDINQKRFAVMLRTRNKKGGLDFYPGEVYLFADGKLIGKSNSDDQNSVMDFVGEAGKLYRAEIRDGRDYKNSKLLARGVISVPKEGELTGLSVLDLILTPVGEEHKPDQEDKSGKDKDKNPDASEKPNDEKAKTESKNKKESDNKSNDTKMKSSVEESDNNGRSKAKSTNAKTGVTGLSGLFAVVGVAAAGLFISKKNK